MPNHVFIATSLDGHIATRDGGIDWLTDVPNPDGSDFGYAAFVSGIDALVMGRGTFEKVLSFGEWPYEKPVFVLSTTLDDVPERVAGKAKIVSGDPGLVVEDLRRQGYSKLYIDGGVVIQGFLAADLIDEMIITRLPILLGGGIPLFGELAEPMKFGLVKNEILCDALVQSSYRRIRE